MSQNDLERCLLCGGALRPVARRAGRLIRACRTCQLVVADADAEQLAASAASANVHTVQTEEAFTVQAIAGLEARRARYAAVGAAKAAEFARRLGQDRLRVLEVGCGTAGYAEGMLAAGHEYVGLDIDRRMVQAAVDRGIPAYCRDLYEFTDSPFDVVMFSQVLEHALEPARFLQHVARLLRPGGLAVADVPNHDSLAGVLSRVAPGRSARYGGVELPHHAVAYRRETLRKAFSVSFSDVDVFCRASDDPVWGQATVLSLAGRAYHAGSRLVGRPSLLVAVGHRPTLD